MSLLFSTSEGTAMLPNVLHELMKALLTMNESKKTLQVKMKALRSQITDPVRTKPREHQADMRSTHLGLTAAGDYTAVWWL